jgi:hypothetical protein
MWLGWLGACGADFVATLSHSEYTPAAARVEWTGPAGHATLLAADGPLDEWRVVSEADVDQGASSLPLALLPAGKTWRWRVEVDTGGNVLRSEVDQFSVLDPPDGLGNPRLERIDRGRSQMADGWWVGYHYGFKHDPSGAIPFVADGEGKVVWWVEPAIDGHRPMRVRPSADGRDVLVLEDHDDPELRRLVRYSLDGTERIETALPDASHDFWENPDGTITYVAYTFSSDELMPGVPGPVVADVVRTVPEGATAEDEPVGGFDFFDDYPADPWFTCWHARWDEFVPGAAEWSHVNSLIRHPEDEGWLLVARHLDAALLVSDGHELLWQVGGLDATLTGGPGTPFEHGHASHAWTDDQGLLHLLVFDNGDHSPKPILTRVVELRIDPDAGQVDVVWELADPEGGFTSFLGDARRLPEGNTVVVWTDRGEVSEYTPDGDEVWRLDVDEPMGRGFWVPRLTLDPDPGPAR